MSTNRILAIFPSPDNNVWVVTFDRKLYIFDTEQCQFIKVGTMLCKRFGIQYLLKGIYTHNGLLYFHTEIKNQSNVPFDVDYITWKIVDKKVAKRTAVQEQIILPLRAQNYATLVPGKKSERTVFTMAKFTIPDDKCLVVELNEKNGGRHQSFVIENEDLVRAGTINELQVR